MNERHNDRLWSLDEILFSLKSAKAESYLEKLDLNLQRLAELEKKGNPQPATADAVLKLYEDTGVQTGYSFPVFIKKYGREVRYSRLVFQMEMKQMVDGCRVTWDDEKRGSLAIELARERGVTPEIAFRWHREEMLFLAGNNVEGHERSQDKDLFLNLNDLLDLESIMLSELDYDTSPRNEAKKSSSSIFIRIRGLS